MHAHARLSAFATLSLSISRSRSLCAARLGAMTMKGGAHGVIHIAIHAVPKCRTCERLMSAVGEAHRLQRRHPTYKAFCFAGVLCKPAKSCTVPCRPLMRPAAVTDQREHAVVAETTLVHASATCTPSHPYDCCNRPRGYPANAPPICAMHLTKPPADEDTAGGTTSREKRPRSTWTGKAQKPRPVATKQEHAQSHNRHPVLASGVRVQVGCKRGNRG